MVSGEREGCIWDQKTLVFFGCFWLSLCELLVVVGGFFFLLEETGLKEE